MNMTNKIQHKGMCDCHGQPMCITTAEAKEILELVLNEVIMVVNNVGLSADDNAAVINAIKEVGNE